MKYSDLFQLMEKYKTHDATVYDKIDGTAYHITGIGIIQGLGACIMVKDVGQLPDVEDEPMPNLFDMPLEEEIETTVMVMQPKPEINAIRTMQQIIEERKHGKK